MALSNSLNLNRPLLGTSLCTLMTAALIQPAAAETAPTGFFSALSGGEAYAQFRPRYEYVKEEGKPDNASAYTMRTQLGYKTGTFYGFMADLQFEDVSTFGDEKFNDTYNGKTNYPVVADPESTEINQAYLAYVGLTDTSFKLGRQRVSLDNERFIGLVGWRQNEQTMDAFSVKSAALGDFEGYYGYINNVNRIFGEGHPTLSDTKMDSHLLNLAYTGFSVGKISAYGYFLDFENSPAASNQTLGLRFNGKTKLSATKLVYTAEYATQSDYADGSPAIDADYYHLAFGGTAGPVLITLGQELLSGDGNYAFSTPLATVHAFNGWADRFINTPVDGLVDTYLSGALPIAGFKFKLVYHDFSADNDGYGYGSEIDFLVAKKINKYLTVLAKYADYSADDNADNVARNPAQSKDIEKFWLAADLHF